MTIMSNDPKYVNLGRDIEKTTNMMSFLNHVKSVSNNLLHQTASFLERSAEDYDLMESKDEEILEHLKELKFIMNSCQETIERAGTEFDYYRDRYDKLNEQLTKLTRSKAPSKKKTNSK